MLLMLKAGGGIRAVLPVCHRSGPYHDWSCDLAPTQLAKEIDSFIPSHSFRRPEGAERISQVRPFSKSQSDTSWCV